MSDLDVLVVGGLGVDHIDRVDALPLPVVDSLLVPPILTVAGHTVTGVALGCLALGLRTAVVDLLDDDLEGRVVWERCAEAGLELHVTPHVGGTRRAVNLVTTDGRRMSLYDARAEHTANPPTSQWQNEIHRSRHVHVTIMPWATAALTDAVAAGRSTSTDLHDWAASTLTTVTSRSAPTSSSCRRHGRRARQHRAPPRARPGRHPCGPPVRPSGR